MIFRALPVNEGDAFLLQDEGKTILVDAGVDKDQCQGFLISQGVQQLSLIICTHFDEDHRKGFLGILENPNIEVKEAWFPSEAGSLYDAMTNKENLSLYSFLNVGHDDPAFGGEFPVYSHALIPPCFAATTKERNQDRLALQDTYLLVGYERGLFALNRSQLDEIKALISLCLKRGVKIRWFRYRRQLENVRVSSEFPFYGLNCVEEEEGKTIESVAGAILALTQINIESLVLKYTATNGPEVLFCADSDLRFLSKGQKICLNDQSISTVAHHGSSDNSKTYGFIEGNGLIYVRSDSGKAKSRPCREYIDLPNEKYCTLCRNCDNSHAIIELEYGSAGWINKNGRHPCRCS